MANATILESEMTVASELATEVPIDLLPPVDRDIKDEIEQFLYLEAELLDDRHFNRWYRMLADDLEYFMPMRSNRTIREMEHENSKRGEIAHFDDNKMTMLSRVKQLETGMHWSEDPPSRSRHLVSNIRVSATDVENEFSVKSNFLCYRNRLDTEVDFWVGERQDLLRRVGSRQWQIAQRYVLLDQNVVLSKNMTVFL
jgi:3-phenylpropionate/cinnamic acid dioxygenase small subunit